MPGWTADCATPGPLGTCAHLGLGCNHIGRALQNYQTQLLEARQDFCLTAAQLDGGLKSVQDTAGPRTISVGGPCTVHNILCLGKVSLAPGHKISLKLEGRIPDCVPTPTAKRPLLHFDVLSQACSKT